MKLIVLLFFMLVALAGCAPTPAPGPANAPVFYVMRHLHTPAGERDPHLTPEGARAAVALAQWRDRPRPRAIYVSQYARSLESAAPLAARLRLAPIRYDAADTAALIFLVRAGPAPALIVGHSNTVPDIVEALGGTRPAPLVHEDFGDLWRVSPRSTVRTRIGNPESTR